MNTDRVEVSTEVAEFIAARIAGYESECPEMYRWLVPHIKKHRILPLLVGWTETVGILASGEIRKFSADGSHSEYEELRPVEEPVLLLGALVQGARDYPDLKALVPEKQSSATECTVCGGSGVIENHPKLICECGGVGWVEESAV